MLKAAYATFNLGVPTMPLSPEVRNFCKALQLHRKPRLLPFTLQDVRYVELQCHINVMHAVREGGGRNVFGWVIWEDPRRHFVEAIFHSVWRDPSGTLRDVTPRCDGEAEVLFLEDPGSRLERYEGHDLTHANRDNTSLNGKLKLRYGVERTPTLLKLLTELSFPVDQPLADADAPASVERHLLVR